MQEKLAVEGENKNTVEKQIDKIVPLINEKAPKEEAKYSKEEVEKLIKKAQKQTEYKTKQLIEKKIEETAKVEPKQVVFVKPRPDVEVTEMNKELQILPFVKLDYNDDELSIHTDYKVSKKFSINKDNKLIIDYKANVNFYTKREDLESKNFKKITVGNHKKNGFFRVVVELDKKPSSYKVDYKNNLITIFNSDEM